MPPPTSENALAALPGAAHAPPAAAAWLAARLLATAPALGALNLTVLALAALAAPARGWALGLHLALAAGLAYGHVRLRLDARLFADLAQARYSPEQLDDALHALGLRPRGLPRSVAERARAALRLWRGLLLASAAQLALLWCTGARP